MALVTSALVEPEPDLLPPADAGLVAHYCCPSFPFVGLCGVELLGIAAETSDWLCAKCVVMYEIHQRCPWHPDGCP